jgi:predicted dehydrogenase
MSNSVNRRDFIKKSAVLSSFFIVPRHVLGNGFLAPSDKINIGFIGAGKQGRGLLKRFVDTGRINVLAIADPHEGKRNLLLDVHRKDVQKAGGEVGDKDVQAFGNYPELLVNKSIDAVVIATPDHWHAVQAVQAAQAGKDIYCEKPLSLTVKEGRAMVNATRKNNRVFQTGSMQRSQEYFRKGAELVRNGYLGDIQEILVCVGNPPKDIDFTAQEIPAHLDWQTWLGPNGDAPYNELLAPTLKDEFWAKWREYKPFGGGYMTDWGAHMYDIAQWALGMDGTGPVSMNPPANYDVNKDKEVKGLQYEYANGIVMKHENFDRGNAIRFIGTEGTMDISRSFLDLPEKLKNVEPKANDVLLPKTKTHYDDFLDCMQTRNKPLCDVEIGHRTATVCNIGNIAYELKRPLQWNPEKEEFVNDTEANALLGRKLNKPYRIKL